MKKKFKPKYFSKIRFSIYSGLFLAFTIALTIAIPIVIRVAGAALNMVFNTTNYITINDENEKGEIFFESDREYLKGDKKYESGAAEKLYNDDNKVIYDAELEGATLLWNKNNALPLSGNEYVNLLSHASVDYVKGGSGSGYVITVKSNEESKNISTNMRDAFNDKGFSVNQTLWDFYSTGAGKNYKYTSPETLCTQWRQWENNEVPWNVYTDAVKNSFIHSTKSSIAIVTISRTGGEYSDLHYNYKNDSDTIGDNARGLFENTPEDNGYLGLTDEEDQMLTNVTALKSSGTFSKVILLLNTGNPIRFKDLVPYANDIDACMWIGQPGSYGINAVVDLLKGKDKNNTPLSPSGHITDTFMYDLNSNPASVNDGNYIYAGDLSKLPNPSSVYYRKYVVYQEGIYVGYRYYETRYEDSVLNRGNANGEAGAINSQSNWKYEEEVAFPFGYGDSYSEFSFKDFEVTRKENGDFVATVKVTNEGNIPAKEAVQIYLQKPYTQYDIDNNIEKSAIELAGYKKTSLLAAGDHETVTIDIPEEYLKTYDANHEKTYIVEQGKYYFSIGGNAHDALNHIIKAKQNSAVTTSKVFNNVSLNNNPTNSNNETYAYGFDVDEDLTTYRYSKQTGKEITNQLDSADLNKYENRGSNSTTYLSRNNWQDTYPTTQVVTMTDGLAIDLKPDVEPEKTGNFPTYSKFTSGGSKPNIAAGDVVAAQFMDAPLYPELASAEDKSKVYEDGKNYVDHWNSMWEKLLDQMSFDEQSLIAANAYHQICGAASINLPGSKQENGPVGITKRAESSMAIPDSNIKSYYYVAYPSAQVVAASFNDELSREVGKSKSEDMLYLGYNGIYGPGINMHRSPYSGRAYEYPSEDPLLAGQIEWYESNGIESKGCLAYAKHFVMNDSETNRAHVGTWNNEQAIREIYCRPFEICFSEGGAHATMNGFNRLGAIWNGASSAMQTVILREEWGWTGINISDWRNPNQNSMSYVQGIMAGTNSFDGNGDATAYYDWKNNPTVCRALRESAKYVIYNVVRTNAMNGMTLNSRTIKVTPWWETMFWMVRNVFLVLAVYALSGLALSIAIPLINKNKSEPEPMKIRVFKETNGRPRLFIDFTKPFKAITIGGISIVLSGLVLAIVLPIALSQRTIEDDIQIVIPPSDNSYPYDTGANIQNRFELEDATIEGTHDVVTGNQYSNNSLLVGSNLIVTYDILSDSRYMVEAHLGIACYHQDDINLATSLSEMINLTINENEIDLTKISVIPTTNDLYEVVDVAFFIPIKIGHNDINFHTLEKFFGVDYLDINTSASIYDARNV